MAERPTEAWHPKAAGLHLASAASVAAILLDAQSQAIGAIRPAVDALVQAADLAGAALQSGHRLIYAGAGSSGLMALADCLELAGTFGIPPERTPMMFAGGAAALLHLKGAAEDEPAVALADLATVRPVAGDVVICLSASGGTPYTVTVAQGAKAAGATVVGIANVPGSALLGASDVAIALETGAEVVAGSTRMGAATAQKVALNILSVLMAIRLGHVHDGYMVNVVADNAKLADRAARIVAAISGQAEPAARAAIVASHGAVKPAVLIAKGATPERAEQLLSENDGHLDRALSKL